MRLIMLSFLVFWSFTALAKPWSEGETFGQKICHAFSNSEAFDSLPTQTKEWIKYFAIEKRTCESFEILLNEESHLVTRLNITEAVYGESRYDLVFITLLDQSNIPMQTTVNWIRSDLKVEFGVTSNLAADGASLYTFYGKSLNFAHHKTILTRSPYIHSGLGCQRSGLGYLAMGLNFACQGVRGTYLSEGDFKWLSPEEISDGRQMIDWAIKFFDTEELGIIGTSYDGFAALAAAIEAPAQVKFVIAGSAPTDVMRHSFTAGGIADLALLRYYYTQENYSDIDASGGFIDEIFKYNKFYKEITSDLIDDQFLKHDNSEWNYVTKNYADHESPFWSERGIVDRLGEISLPVYIVAGLIDDQDSLDSFDNFKALEKAGKNRDNYHFILGNWGHSYPEEISYDIIRAFLFDYENKYPERIYLYSQAKQELGSVEEFPLRNQLFFEFELHPSESYFSTIDNEKIYIYDPEVVNYGESNTQDAGQFIVPQSAYITGVGSIELELSFSSASLDFIFYIAVEDGKTGEFSFPFKKFRMRKRVINNGGESQKVVIDIPPVMFKVKQGDKIYIGYSHYDTYVLLNGQSDKEGIDFFKEFDSAVVLWTSGVNIMGKVSLPIEATFEQEELSEDVASAGPISSSK